MEVEVDEERVKKKRGLFSDLKNSRLWSRPFSSNPAPPSPPLFSTTFLRSPSPSPSPLLLSPPLPSVPPIPPSSPPFSLGGDATTRRRSEDAVTRDPAAARDLILCCLSLRALLLLDRTILSKPQRCMIRLLPAGSGPSDHRTVGPGPQCHTVESWAVSWEFWHSSPIRTVVLTPVAEHVGVRNGVLLCVRRAWPRPTRLPIQELQVLHVWVLWPHLHKLRRTTVDCLLLLQPRGPYSCGLLQAPAKEGTLILLFVFIVVFEKESAFTHILVDFFETESAYAFIRSPCACRDPIQLRMGPHWVQRDIPCRDVPPGIRPNRFLPDNRDREDHGFSPQKGPQRPLPQEPHQLRAGQCLCQPQVAHRQGIPSASS